MLRRLTLLAAAGLFGLSEAPGVAEANTCRALEMQLMQAQAGGGSARLRSVHNLLIDRGCRGGRRIAERAPKAKSVRVRTRGEVSRRSSKRREKPAASFAGGTYRTLCVRSCDGYYFPISFSTTRDHFGDDQASCREMCPAGDADLYYHELGSQGPEDMLSLDGALYTSLPAAFSYRSALNKSCACGRPAAAGALFASDPAGLPSAERPPRAPKARPTPGEDPETLANRAGGFDPTAVDRIAASAGADAPSAVRIVGPHDIQPVILSEFPDQSHPEAQRR